MNILALFETKIGGLALGNLSRLLAWVDEASVSQGILRGTGKYLLTYKTLSLLWLIPWFLNFYYLSDLPLSRDIFCSQNSFVDHGQKLYFKSDNWFNFVYFMFFNLWFLKWYVEEIFNFISGIGLCRHKLGLKKKLFADHQIPDDLKTV